MCSKKLAYTDFLAGSRPLRDGERPVTFRVTSLLGIQQRWASLQRAPVAGVPYLLALSKSSLNGVLGVECSNHSVPTILFNDLAQSVKVGLFHVRDFCVTSGSKNSLMV